VRNQFAGRDSTSDRAGINAKHFGYLADGEEPDAVTPILGTVAFQATSFSTWPPSPTGHYSRSPGAAAARRLAMYAFMLNTVIFREPPSLKESNSPAANSA
jgi:hypothetical protein